MNKYFFLILILGSIVFTGCNCPDDERKGELSLEQKAQNFVPYDGAETLIFTDETGASLSFIAPRGMEIKNDKLCYKTTCTEAKFGSPSSCDYYDSESRRFTYFTDDNSAVIDILLYSEVYERGMPEFYDALQIGLSTSTINLSANHLIEIRLDGMIDSTKINFDDPFIETEEIVLNGQPFLDVLVFEEGTLGLYFKEGQGVIGFKDNEHTWVIQD